MRSFVTMMLGTAAVLASLKAAHAETDPPKLDPKEEAKKGEAAEANAKALTSIPQLTAFRGGSLGLPASAQTQGLQASLDAKLFSDQASADAFAQVAGLPLNDNASVDVFIEQLDQDMPRILLDGSTVKHELLTQKLSSAGMRFRIRHDVLLVSQLQKDGCWEALSTPVLDGEAPIVTLRGDNPTLRKDVAAKVENKCDLDKIHGVAGTTWWLGARVVRRSPIEDGGNGSNGGALEIMRQHDGPHDMYFLGLSGVHFSRAVDKLGNAMAEFPSMRIARVSAGGEFRGSHKTDGTDLIPRVGIYGVASHAWWDDRYTTSSASRFQQSTELELGFYAGGHFSDKFSGLIAVRVTKPFGGEEHGTEFVLSVIPSATGNDSTTKKGEEKKDPPPPAAPVVTPQAQPQPTTTVVAPTVTPPAETTTQPVNGGN